MKKILFIILSTLLLVGTIGCSGNKETKVSLDTFIKAYTDNGISVDAKEKPFFTMVGAQNGVIFKVDEEKTAIYEYKSASELKKAQTEYSVTKDWPSNGRFLLESDSQKAKDIFSKVK